MMESVDFFDKHLDPPEPMSLRDECDGCGNMFPVGDVTRTGTPGNYRWLCINCLDDLDDTQHLEEDAE